SFRAVLRALRGHAGPEGGPAPFLRPLRRRRSSLLGPRSRRSAGVPPDLHPAATENESVLRAFPALRADPRPKAVKASLRDRRPGLGKRESPCYGHASTLRRE